MRRTVHACLIATMALALAACAVQPGANPSSDATRPTRTAPGLSSVPPSDEPVTGEVPAEIMDSLVADAAERGGADRESIEVIDAQQVTWNDGSLGCPEPGMSYTMALIEGYHVVLLAGDEELDYRVTADGGFRLCENGGRPSD